MNLIKEFRRRAKLSQRELSQLCNWNDSSSRISNYETGVSTPTLSDCRLIVAALNKAGEPCSLDDVFPPQTIQLQAS